MRHISARHVARLGAISGCAIVLATSLVAAAHSPEAILFALWALLPYTLLWIGSFWAEDLPSWAGASVALLAGEIGIRLAVIVFPAGSTAAIALVFSPFYLAAFVLPAGWAGGWIVGRFWRASKLIGYLSAVVFFAICGLFSLSLARPDLTPWAIRQRNQLLRAIGEPRVVTQDHGWARVPASEESGWLQVDELDGVIGDEIAVADHRQILLLDPATLAVRERLQHGSDSGSGSGSRWSWYSRLARFDDRRVIVQTGGGYQETEILELDGSLAWRYRPNPSLPPSTLRPLQLDGDGLLDLVAIDGARLIRLDQQGNELWDREIPYSSRLLFARSSPRGLPAWIVTQTQAGFEVWNAEGRQIGSLAARGCKLAAVVDLAAGRRLLCGTDVLRAYELGGATDLEIDLEGLAPIAAAAARSSRNEAPFLVIISAAPRDVGRWRLAIYEAGSRDAYRRIVYDEVLAEAPTLQVAREADGHEVIWLRLPGSGI